MRRNRLGRFLVLSSMVLAVILLAGCKQEAGPVKISSPWPKGDRERTVPAPPEKPRWPFTGEKAEQPSDITRRPLSIKIENSSAARPQTGLNSADVVYETISEGGITRFNCIFHSKLPDVVGPVRSARLSDLWVVPQYDGLFFFSGASASVNRAVRQAQLANLSQDVGVSLPYFRSRQRSAPHNLFLETDKAYRAAEARDYRTLSQAAGLQFERRSSEESRAVSEISIPFSNANRVRWVYEDRMWSRSNNGAVHIDADTGQQITAKNVVVIWARYDVASRDKVGSVTYRVELGGQGRVSVFRDGQRFDGTWKAGRDAPPKFTDSSGKPIKLATGRTWFQVLPLNGVISMK